MTWATLTDQLNNSFARLRSRFPYAEADVIQDVCDTPESLTHYLAKRHNLTPLEAREELEDWMYLQGLARDASAIGMDEAAFSAN